MTPSYFKVGLFVLVGLLLLVAGVVAFGRGLFGEKQVMMETYFDGSVQGLEPGAAIKYRGVQVGVVDYIGFCRNFYPLDPLERPEEEKYARYVYVRVGLYPDLVAALGDHLEKRVERMAAEGLRVRLASQGLTGISALELDYVDHAKNPPLAIDWEPQHYYIPSTETQLTRISSSLERTLTRLQDVDFEGIGSSLDRLLVTLDQKLGDLDVDSLSRETVTLLDQTRQVMERLSAILDDPELDRLGTETALLLRETREELSPRLASASSYVEEAALAFTDLTLALDHIVDTPEVKEGVDELAASGGQLRSALARFHRILARNEEDLESFVKNLRVVSDHLRRISGDARRYPARTFFGEPPPAVELEEDR